MKKFTLSGIESHDKENRSFIPICWRYVDMAICAICAICGYGDMQYVPRLDRDLPRRKDLRRLIVGCKVMIISLLLLQAEKLGRCVAGVT